MARSSRHLQRLVGSWGLLADFCFADLLLFAPERSADSGTVRGARTDPAGDDADACTARTGSAPSSPTRSGPSSPASPVSARSSKARSSSRGSGRTVRVLAIPVRLDGRGDRRAHARVGADLRSSARRAGAHVRRHLQPVRPDDRGGHLPVRHRRARARGGAARRRRRDAARCATAGSTTRRRTPCRRSTGSACTPTPKACGSRELGLDEDPGPDGLRERRAGRPRRSSRARDHACCSAASRCSTTAEVSGARRARARHLRAAPS